MIANVCFRRILCKSCWSKHKKILTDLGFEHKEFDYKVVYTCPSCGKTTNYAVEINIQGDLNGKKKL